MTSDKIILEMWLSGQSPARCTWSPGLESQHQREDRLSPYTKPPPTETWDKKKHKTHYDVLTYSHQSEYYKKLKGEGGKVARHVGELAVPARGPELIPCVLYKGNHG